MNKRTLFIISPLVALLVAQFVLNKETVVGEVESLITVENFYIPPNLVKDNSSTTVALKAGQRADLINCQSKSQFYYIVKNSSGQEFMIPYLNYTVSYPPSPAKIKWHVEKGSLLNFYRGTVWFCHPLMKEELLKQVQ
jgi:hypothetical protein